MGLIGVSCIAVLGSALREDLGEADRKKDGSGSGESDREANGYTAIGDLLGEGNREMSGSFRLHPDQARELCRRQALGRDFISVGFAAPLKFSRVGESVQAEVYQAVTVLPSGEACAGKYAFQATLQAFTDQGHRKYETKIERVHLIDRLVPPRAPPGTRSILPGQKVVRLISPRAIAALDDAYAIELPAKDLVRVNLYPWPSYPDTDSLRDSLKERRFGKLTVTAYPPPQGFPFRLSVSRDGKPVASWWGKHVNDMAFFFMTTSAGVYRLQVTYGERSQEGIPDRYSFFVSWGEEPAEWGGNHEWKVTWLRDEETGGGRPAAR